ncbi:NdvB protein [Alteromonadaceae bacterium M269]|nr:NdvB protein [Alteromonadaceae bacterium M269]
MKQNVVFRCSESDESVSLYSPTLMPNAGGFLWNKKLMIQMNCRGYAVAQHMQPEPSKYAYGPAIEGKTFMQPEHHYYAHHPGRFFYLKDEESGEVFSLPYEPTRKTFDEFIFTHRAHSLHWVLTLDEVVFELTLKLLGDEAAEHWHLKISNGGSSTRKFSLYSYFSIGYMSWMNQSATYDESLQSIIATSVTPYQKVDEFKKNQHLKDLTYFFSERKPDSWLAQQGLFEGEGGLQSPDALLGESLPNQACHYQVPAAVMQYRLLLGAEDTEQFNWVFGPAKDRQEIEHIINVFAQNQKTAVAYAAQKSCLKVSTPDKTFDHYVNHWLPRQVSYHGESNRLTTDPQTRNFLQDAMGMVFLDPEAAKKGFLKALSQQSSTGAMPDGILLHPDAELKYINTVPHSDHNVWLLIFLSTYLQETGDLGILQASCPFSDYQAPASVFEHIQRAMCRLVKQVDHRSLSYIYQGDWCDPMNMVGVKGKGVSAWLTLATSYSCSLWSEICESAGQEVVSRDWANQAKQFNDAINQYCWDGQWYARGITDDGRVFGVSNDAEGRIFLNPQTWSILSGAASPSKIKAMLGQIDQQLDTPFGPMLLAPSYTAFQKDIGRLTQKSAGVAENGSVYNHASAFYIYSLYQIGESQRAYSALRKMLVDSTDALTKGQLPVYIPNYYRGAYHQYPDYAGKSSQLFNTGTVAWYYRSVIEGLFGLKGHEQGLEISPQLPDEWDEAKVSRQFRQATFHVEYKRTDAITGMQISANGSVVDWNVITDIVAGETYSVSVTLPRRVKRS